MGKFNIRSLVACYSGYISFLITALFLVVGLWPANFFPVNKVNWLKDRPGIHLYGKSIMYSVASLDLSGNKDTKDSSFSLELWLASDIDPVKSKNPNFKNYGNILAIYNDKILGFSISQFKRHIIIKSRDNNLISKRHFYKAFRIPNILTVGNKSFITITSSQNGTSIYLNGLLLEHLSNIKILNNYKISGKILIGNLINGLSPWRGKIFGLGIYNRLLTEKEALANYQKWTSKAHLLNFDKMDTLALYTFREGKGSVINDIINSGNNIIIPKIYHVMKRSPFFFHLTKQMLSIAIAIDILVNLFGFIPFGFFLLAYFTAAHRLSTKTKVVTVIFSGALISFTIELLQIFLPSRSSSLIDLFCNTSGTIIGIMIFQCYLHKDITFSKATH